MLKKSAISQSTQQWLDTLPSDFDPTLSVVPGPSRDRANALTEKDPRVELAEVIGQGGMATVHRGRQMSLDREVAVKIKRANLDASTVDILHEAWLTSALEHPNIVPVYDLSLDAAGDPMVLMRRIEGTEWGQLFNEPDVVLRDFSASDAMDWHLRVFLQVCNAVHYAHSIGVIHRDIKPDNVMVGMHGQVYLLDWGIAISKRGDLADKLSKLSDENRPAGTPCYLAPEMLSGDKESVDERTDVYLLGATLYHLMTGKPPHRGKSLEEVLNSVTTGLVAIPESLPSEMRSILSRALAQDPGDRFASVAELRRSVDDYLSHRSSYQLEKSAQEHLKVLQQALETQRLDNTEDRSELYKLYSTCRSGYRAALQLWDQSPSAQEGLYTATAAMIDAEIEHGTPRAATALLSELETPPEELVLRVSDAQYSEGLEHQDMAHMASIARKWSSRRGARLRSVMILVVGLGFAVLAAMNRSFGPYTRIAVDLSGLLGLGVYALAARRQGQLSGYNSRAVGILVTLFAIEIFRRILAITTDTPADQLLLHDGLLFLATVSVATAAFEGRLWPCIPVYAVAYASAMADISHAGIGYALGHFSVAVSMAWIWWPRQSMEDASRGRRGKLRSSQ